MMIRGRRREDDEKRKKSGADGSLLNQWTCNQMVKIKSKNLDIKTLTEWTKLLTEVYIRDQNGNF